MPLAVVAAAAEEARRHQMRAAQRAAMELLVVQEEAEAKVVARASKERPLGTPEAASAVAATLVVGMASATSEKVVAAERVQD